MNGKRTVDDYLGRRRSIGSPILVITSDNWYPFEEGLLNVYACLEIPPY
jgi:hypothetical protein